MLGELACHAGLWLTAPPGAGKTTLVAAWLQPQPLAVLWLQLDAADADPATLAQSLDLLWEHHASEPPRLPQLAADELGDLAAWLRRRLRHVLPRLPERWVLVLDNMHELPAASPLHGALAAALAELPEGVQWVFISRELPPAAYTGGLARRLLVQPDPAALRLDDDEITALLQLHGRPASMRPALAPAQGWAAGLTLMLQGPAANADWPAFDAHERLFDYFAGEVLARMAEPEREALCRLAYLPATTEATALAQSGWPGAPALLQRLAAANLFTERRGGPQPVYRFHGLFSAFLRRSHAQAAGAAAVAALLVDSGERLLAQGDGDAGLALLLEAGAFERAAAAIESQAPGYLAEGRPQALGTLIGQLPPALAEGLAYWRGMARIDTAPALALADFEQVLATALQRGDAEMQLHAAALAPLALVQLGRVREFDRWIELLDRHPGPLARLLADPAAVPRLVPGLLLALLHRCPWHAQVPVLVELGERMLHDEHAVGQRLPLGALAFHFQWQGDLERLQRTMRRLDELWVPGLSSPAALMRWWNVGIVVKVLSGMIDAAALDAQRALELVRAEPALAGQRAAAEIHAGFVALARLDGAAAREHLERAAQALRPDNVSDRGMFEQQAGLAAMLEGDAPAAQRLTRAAVQSGREGGYVVREHIAMISHALALARGGELAAARAVLDEAWTHPLQSVCRWHQWVALNVGAYTALLAGDRALAQRELGELLRLWRESGYGGGVLLRVARDLLPRLAALALAEGIEPAVALAMIRRFELEPPPEAGEQWPWPVRIRVLGGFAVEVDGAPMASSRKESRRLLELLRLLAAHGTQPLALDRVADALWPDAEGDAARNALDNALHRLRRQLGGEDRVLLRQGALALNPRRCWVDVDQLAGLLERAAAGSPDAATKASLARWAGAALLPDDALPAIVVRRERLERQLSRALQAGAAHAA